MLRRIRDGERGQTLAFITIFMTGLLGMGAIAIDVGQWYLAHRNAQNIADAAALAGASNRPAGTSSATAAATANANLNRRASDIVTASIVTSTGGTTDDTVRVVVQRPVSGTFSRVFLGGDRTMTASAEATVRSYTTVPPLHDVMPWAVMRGTWTAGTTYPIFGDTTTPSQSGAMDLNAGSGCDEINGSDGYREALAGADHSGTDVCTVSIGDQYTAEPGSMPSPTEQGLCRRINGTTGPCQSALRPLNEIVQMDGAGNATILNPDSPQLVLLPIVENLDGSTTWPQGSSQDVRVVGYAWFVITGYAGPGGARTVYGTFIRAQMNDTTMTTGAWNPSSSLFTTVLSR